MVAHADDVVKYSIVRALLRLVPRCNSFRARRSPFSKCMSRNAAATRDNEVQTYRTLWYPDAASTAAYAGGGGGGTSPGGGGGGIESFAGGGGGGGASYPPLFCHGC